MEQFERDLRTGVTRINRATGQPYATTSWSTVDLEPFKHGEVVIEPPAFLKRDDGRCLIYPGRAHVFFGESGSLKSWGALLACKSVIAAGYSALYVDMEDSEPSFVERCRLVGVPEGAIGTTLAYMHPTEALLDEATRSDFWLYELQQRRPALVVLDGVTELYAMQGWDVNKAEDAARFQKTFAFGRVGIASIAIDHTSKDAGRGALGSQHKRAGLDGAEYEFKSKVRGGRGGLSIAEVSVTSKDRHGRIHEWTSGVAGKLQVAPDGVELLSPTLTDIIDPRDDAMDRVLAFVRDNPGSTGRTIRDGTRVGRESLGEALSALKMLGKIRDDGTPSRGSWVVSES